MKKLMFFATLMAAMFCFQGCEDEGNEADAGDNVTNEPEYVDLGLSVKWATFNVGANSPEEYGDYFAWGEIAPKEEYTEENSVTGGNGMLFDISGDAQYDAARANWGGAWRMPTSTEIEELLNSCSHQMTTKNGVVGCLFTSNLNGRSIFLPAAGYRYGSSLNDAGDFGTYWSATFHNGDGAETLRFFSGDVAQNWDYRDVGHTIRPVTE